MVKVRRYKRLLVARENAMRVGFCSRFQYSIDLINMDLRQRWTIQL